MKKAYRFDQMSETKRCACGNSIKKRFENSENHELCFKCYARSQKAKGHLMVANLKMK